MEINYVVHSSPQLCSKSFSSVRVVSYSVVVKYAFELHVKTRAFLYVKCMLLLLNKKKFEHIAVKFTEYEFRDLSAVLFCYVQQAGETDIFRLLHEF